jgi:hypothetical protein
MHKMALRQSGLSKLPSAEIKSGEEIKKEGRRSKKGGQGKKA